MCTGYDGMVKSVSFIEPFRSILTHNQISGITPKGAEEPAEETGTHNSA
jgi:hypothetical protein